MKRFYQQELEDLRTKLILLGEKVNEVSQLAIDGFLENDLGKLKYALSLDNTIDKLESEIAQACVRYITLRAPVSVDVRFIFVAIKASHDLERAGDEAQKIASQAKKVIKRDGSSGETASIGEMSKLACDMMKNAITAFVEEDIDLAKKVIESDKVVNKFNRSNFKFFSGDYDLEDSENATHFQKIFISKSIERIADHAKNLGEEVIYLLTGNQDSNE